MFQVFTDEAVGDDQMNHLFSVHLHSGRVTRRTGLNGSDQILPVWLLEGGRSQQVHRNRDVPLCSSFCSVEVCCFRRDFRFPARQLWLFRRSQTGGGANMLLSVVSFTNRDLLLLLLLLWFLTGIQVVFRKAFVQMSLLTQ